MNLYCIIIPILLPLIGGILIPLIHFKKRETRQLYVSAVVLFNSVMTFLLLCMRPEGSLMAINLAGNLEVTFHIDGMGVVFAGVLAALWPLATLYSFEYMKHEKNENKFFTFFTMTYGITMGLAFSANFMTLYMFYEMLTLITLPLVMHSMTRKAILAGRKYIFYSIGGAAFAFIGFIFIFSYGSSMDFVYGGVLSIIGLGDKANILRAVYVLAVLGFGVKAALFPFHGWLPSASIAPTPVTALLHAVAVVNAGAFAIIRITYYSFGTELLRGTWAQTIVLIFAAVTILYGSVRAVKESHLKRRLAYSTISNLSYIVFSAVLMTPEGLTGSLIHMVFHSLMKITLFFCSGAILFKTGREYVADLDGFGRKMPLVMGVFTLAGAALAGVPPLAGFISKWNIASAAISEGGIMPVVGIVVLMISAFFTLIYIFQIVFRAYFPKKEFDYGTIADVKDPNGNMLLPLILFAVGIVGLSLFSKPLIQMLQKIANGLF